jgi:hypothetical protein
LGATTIGRIRKEKPARPPFQPQSPKPAQGPMVVAKRRNHVFDLTILPTRRARGREKKLTADLADKPIYDGLKIGEDVRLGCKDHQRLYENKGLSGWRG